MTIRTILFAAIILLLPLPVWAQNSTGLEALNTTKAFKKAIIEADSAKAASLLANDALILESGKTETKTEYLSHHFFADGRFLGAMKREIIDQKIWQEGSIVWIATTSRLTGRYKDKQRSINAAELIVLRKVQDSWLIAAVHWS